MLMLKSHTLLKPSGVRRPTMAHKMDLGFHHYNMQQTSREAFARPMGRRSTELLTTQVGGTVVRSLPTDGDSGFVDVPEGGPADPMTPKDIDEELLLAYGGQGSGVTGATQPPPQEMGPSSGGAGSTMRGKSSGAGGADRDLVNAHWYPTMPSGAAAHNAAHCEPIPGDWPEPAPQLAPPDAVSPDEPLDAIHAMGAAHGDSQSGPVGGASAGAARDDSSLPAHDQDVTQQQGNQQGRAQEGAGSHDSHAASQPADNPEAIKAVVREETLADSPQGQSETA